MKSWTRSAQNAPEQQGFAGIARFEKPERAIICFVNLLCYSRSMHVRDCSRNAVFQLTALCILMHKAKHYGFPTQPSGYLEVYCKSLRSKLAWKIRRERLTPPLWILHRCEMNKRGIPIESLVSAVSSGNDTEGCSSALPRTGLQLAKVLI